jgi:YD repeat-containing protein
MNRKTNEVYVGVTTNKFIYNGANDLLTLTDGKNQTTSWIYDSFGRVTNKVDAANNIVLAYKYDPNNHLTNRWSIAKGSTTLKYDAVNNLTNIVYPTSPALRRLEPAHEHDGCRGHNGGRLRRSRRTFQRGWSLGK